MVFILNEHLEGNVPGVLEWLHHEGSAFVVVNSTDEFTDVDLEINDDSIHGNITFGDKHVELSQVKAFWYRRGDFLLSNKARKDSLPFLEQYYGPEWENFTGYLTIKLSEVPCIGSPQLSYLDKLTMLDAARKVGLKLTQTWLVSSKKRLLQLLDQHPKMITKGIGESMEVKAEGRVWAAATERIEREKAEAMPDRFFPSMVQPYVDKLLEIRVFYLHGKKWAMAIFSQNDPQTRLDYRNYNYERPNRNVPFQLPEKISEKIDALMDLLGLNTGSLDFILTPDYEFIFLEVNPDGQYGWVSENCNYYLDKAIADVLSRQERTRCFDSTEKQRAS